jgi:ketosteroid isomerase-like protein
MRSPLALALLVVALSSASAACSGGPPPPAMAKAADSGADEKEIARVLDDWHEAAARAEEARYFGHFAPGAVFLGTDASERWTLDAFRTWAHPKFASGKAWTMKSRRRSVMVARSGDFAWFDEDLASSSMGPLRGSGVLVHGGSDGHWRIVHYALSFTVPNERVKDVRKLLATDGE